MNLEIRQLAHSEGVAVPELLREALAFYAQLSPAARRSLRAMTTLNRGQALTAAGQAAGRAIVKAGFDMVRMRGSEAAGHLYPEEQLASEDAIADEAVRLTRKATMAFD